MARTYEFREGILGQPPRCPFRNSAASFYCSRQAAGFVGFGRCRYENNLIRAIVPWMSPMPFPFAGTVALTDLQRAQLESLVRAGSTPQALVFRCRLILRAADRDHPTNLQIAAEFDCNRHTVAGWRNRYLSNGLAGLQDAPRSGRPRRFSPSERLDLINLASSTTEQQGCPATRWSLDDLAATLINRTAHD